MMATIYNAEKWEKKRKGGKAVIRILELDNVISAVGSVQTVAADSHRPRAPDCGIGWVFAQPGQFRTLCDSRLLDPAPVY